MSLPLRVGRIARAEFYDAIDWYELRCAGTGAAFKNAIEQVLDDIELRPYAHPEVFNDVRAAIVSGYPYVVYYRPEAALAIVLAIFHTSRNPADWQKRT